MPEPESSPDQSLSPVLLAPIEPTSSGVQLTSTDTEKDPDVKERKGHHGHRKNQLHREVSEEELEHVEVRGIARRFVVSRPRALQYTYHDQVISNVVRDEEMAFRRSARPELSDLSREDSEESHHHHHHDPGNAEGIAKSRERVDLFIDLIWVGIISNLSEVYSALFFDPEQSQGLAVGVFIIAFTASWRIWNILREFMSNYYMDDVLQRLFIFWILVLSVFYGNQLAYLPEDIEKYKHYVIILYLFIRASFAAMEAIYAIFIPWLRWVCVFHTVLMLPAVGLWIAGMELKGNKALGPILCALVWEYFVPVALDTKVANRLTPNQYRKALDPRHFQSRFASFFILAVGEGVLQLISRGPLGVGITGTAAVSVWSLNIYFIISFLYFNRDQSKYYIPAVRRKGWRVLLWVSFHIPLFSSFLTLASSVMFMLRNHAQLPENVDQNDEKVPAEDLRDYIYSSMWTMSVSLSIILISMTCLALLDKSLDPPGTLRVNNRYVRLSGRIVYVVVILTVPIKKDLSMDLYLGIAGVMMSFLTSWEWVVSLEKGGSFFEPRGLTAILSSNRRAKKQFSSVPDAIRPNNEGA
ncbi:hypothetical protein NA57DRAFT_58899 [Rhizodiscina lignyota]|uniref:Low temperature requirement protein A n=1 Tax=Rhizodiscina lignyota TaxID=1504668 RepID=A0A9P4M7H3_9PEZI|nr:hypothetical protein NA57DRAFT_58899 [Rhizodiscina lignyota]